MPTGPFAVQVAACNVMSRAVAPPSGSLVRSAEAGALRPGRAAPCAAFLPKRQTGRRAQITGEFHAPFVCDCDPSHRPSRAGGEASRRSTFVGTSVNHQPPARRRASWRGQLVQHAQACGSDDRPAEHPWQPATRKGEALRRRWRDHGSNSCLIAPRTSLAKRPPRQPSAASCLEAHELHCASSIINT